MMIPTPVSQPDTDLLLPLTREQEGLWIEWKLSPMGISYNTCIQMQLDGPLDVDRFQNAIADVVAQFELLQAYCVEVDSQPYFALSPDRYQMEVIDISDGAQSETPALKNKAMGMLTRRRDAAIDLTTFPLIRSALISTARDRHYFIGVVPHIISDGYSAVFVLKAISTAYNEGKAGLVEAFGTAPDWQDYLQRRAELDPAKRPAAVSHWQGVLADAQHITPICAQAPEEAGGVLDVDGKRHFFSLDGDKVVRFARMARSQKTSLFSILAALYAVFLYRQTGQEDLVVVFPVNQRPAGFKDAFGFYVNMIPLRVDLSGNPTFLELVNQIGQRRRADKKHQHLPGLDIVKAKREAAPGFDGRLCNVSMAQTVSRFEGLDIPGVVATALDNDLIHVRDDLSLMYEISEEQIGLWLEYRESSFSDAEIEAMGRRLFLIAQTVDENPEMRVADIELVDPAEQQRLLALGAGAQLTLEADNYATLFAQSAAAHPDAIALQMGAQQVNYAQLDAWSGALADTFKAQGQPVAILMKRSIGQIAAMLGSLRAGVPYVPLDPEQGPDRIQGILATLEPGSIACGERQYELLDAQWHDITFTPELSQQGASTGEAAVANSGPANVAPSASAYVIYTSGSTGVPKGVEVEHLALAARISWLKNQFPLQAGEAVLQNTNYAFDVSVAEIFWPLASGAKLVLTEPDAAQDPRYLAELISMQQITSLCMVPSALGLLVTNAEGEQLGSLERILSAGEALSMPLARQLLRGTTARLFNVYGPTEATIYATCKEISLQDTKITIGQSIGAGSVAIVNDSHKMQPLGVEGELCLGGIGLAKGYLGQQELTSGRFPTSLINGERWYLTGDRARLLDNGEVEYLGRADAQVKLRGYRIELGEIEHVLSQQTGVEEAALLMHEEGGAKQLLAFAVYAQSSDQEVPPANEPLGEQRWRETLRRSLPGYMVPNNLYWVSSLPRLASGKLNRAALLAMRSQPKEQALKLPTTAEEQAMARVWARVLGLPLDQIGLHSNFFELGGDSLMLIALATQAEAEGLYIDVHELFEHATIAEALPLARTQPRQLINQAPVSGRYNLLPRHHKFFEDNFEHPAHWNRTFLLRYNRHLDAAALEKSLQAAIRHHDGLRLTFHDEADGRYFQYHNFAPELATVVTHDLTPVALHERENKIYDLLNEANTSLDLHKPPLISVMLFDDESTSILGLVVHHLLIDMRSCYILLEDLLAGYQASVGHKEIRLPPKTTSLAQWSESLAKQVDAQWFAEEVPYWQAQLSQIGHALPGQGLAEPSTDGQQRTLKTSLSRGETERLTRELPKELDTTVPSILLGAFADVFKSWCGADALVVNTCGIGRDAYGENINLSRTVGELNTVFPLALDLSKLNGQRAAKQAYAELPNNGSRYGALRYIARHPELNTAEPEVFFNYVSRVDTSLQSSLGVKVEMAPAGVHSSHPDNHSCYALYLEVLVQDGVLDLHIGFSETRFQADDVERALQQWRERLVDVIDARRLEI